MDPVTTALLSAISSGLNNLASEAVKDAYKSAKQAIKKKLGISSAIDALEKNPESKQRQVHLAEELAAKNASGDPELIALAQRLLEAIKEGEAGPRSLGKYKIEASGAQVGAIGDGIHIEGGIHFHQYGASRGGEFQSSPSANETDARQSDEPNSVRMNLLHLSDLHFGTKEDAHRWHGQLADDLKRELDCDHLDAMIISGDVANMAAQEEYDAATIFIEQVCAEFTGDFRDGALWGRTLILQFPNRMQCGGCVYAGFAYHMAFVSATQNYSNWIFNVRPQSALRPQSARCRASPV